MAVPGGVNQMHHNPSTKNEFVPLLCYLCLLFVTVAIPAHAAGINTQAAELLLSTGSASNETGQRQILDLPSDVSVHGDKIYVVDGGHHRVVVYDTDRNFLFTFAGHGAGPGQLDYPVGIDAAEDGRVYVADSGNHRVQIFSGKGEYIDSFATQSDGRPIDVLRHSKTGRLLVSSSNHTVSIYSDTGRLLSTWGGNGDGRGEFRYPATMAELADGRIAVVDVLNSRVQVFNMDGSLSLVVGEWGVSPGQLFRPKGVAVDAKGNFYISDSYLGAIQKFADDGSFTAVLGNDGKPVSLLTPVGMDVESQRLYVVEMKNDTVSVFQLAH